METRSIIITICFIALIIITMRLTNLQYHTQLYTRLCPSPTISQDAVNYNIQTIPEGKSFYQISSQYKTDKVNSHHYELLYEKYLAKYVGSDLHILEIGLGCGMSYGPGASAHVWRYYLGPKANIYFLEFNRACGEEWYKSYGVKLNITMFYGSQEDVAVLNNTISRKGTFDVIVDDGGHSMTQQITSLIHLLPKVRSGGLYVIEDLLTSYIPGAGGGYLRSTTTIEFIKRLVDDIQAISPQKTTTLGNRIRSFEIADEIIFFNVK